MGEQFNLLLGRGDEVEIKRDMDVRVKGRTYQKVFYVEGPISWRSSNKEGKGPAEKEGILKKENMTKRKKRGAQKREQSSRKKHDHHHAGTRVEGKR